MNYLYLLLILIFPFAACTNDKESNNERITSEGTILTIEASANLSFGETDSIRITFKGGFDGCAAPDHIKAESNGQITYLKAYYNYPSKPQACTQHAPIHTLIYVYKPTIKGICSYRSNRDASISASTIVY